MRTVLTSLALRQPSSRQIVHRFRGSRPYSSNLTEISNEQFITESVVPSYHFQRSLPRLPIPTLEATCSKYLTYVQPLLDESTFGTTQKAVDAFLNGPGRDLHALLVENDKANLHTSYISKMWYDMYLSDRSSVLLNSNPHLMLRPDPNRLRQLDRASSLIHSSLLFYRSLKEQKLSPEIFHTNPARSKTKLFSNLVRLVPSSYSWYAAYMVGAYPLDMSQYNLLFSTSRIPTLKADVIQHHDDSKHIIVIANNHFFKVEVLDKSGRVLAPETLRSRLASVQALAFKSTSDGTSAKGPPLGAGTGLPRDDWARLRDNVRNLSPTNADTIDTIESGLFVLCLDSSADAPASSTDANRAFLHGDGVNRWFDKSFQLIVTANGQAGVNFEHSWGDGVAVLRFVNEVFDHSIKSEPTSSLASGDIVLPDQSGVSHLPLNLNQDLTNSLKEAEAKVKTEIGKLEFQSIPFSEFGRDYIKKKRLSPDGLVQMSFQLAYQKLKPTRTTAPTTYESASTSGYKHGRTEAIRPASLESLKMVRAFTDKTNTNVETKAALLRDAVNVHSKRTRDCLLGQGVDRHLFALRTLAGPNLPVIFQDEAYKLLNRNIVSTSTLVSPSLEGGGFAPVVPEGLGVGYGATDAEMLFNVTSYRHEAADFVQATVESLREFRDVLDVAAPPSEPQK